MKQDKYFLKKIANPAKTPPCFHNDLANIGIICTKWPDTRAHIHTSDCRDYFLFSEIKEGSVARDNRP